VYVIAACIIIVVAILGMMDNSLTEKFELEPLMNQLESDHLSSSSLRYLSKKHHQLEERLTILSVIYGVCFIIGAAIILRISWRIFRKLD
jgi:hypothetical protein